MKNKKTLNSKKFGFTLIELLAVILILGIIALIAIPTVSKIIDDAKKGAFESTLNNIDRKVNETCSKELLKGQEITTTYKITNGVINPHIDIKGKLPDGDINVDSSCGVTYLLSDGKYTGTKNDPSDENPIISKGGTTDSNGSYAESDLNGADPQLIDSIIPVSIANDGTVSKADLNSEWYNYNKKEWANAISVKKSSRDSYMKAKGGSKINESDILAYFVWIPRFSYTMPSDAGIRNPKLINIKFENKNVKSNGDATGVNYYTHPAFTYDGKELNGLWVGKFETTEDPANPCSTSLCETSDNDVATPTILPNLSFIKNQSISKQFSIARQFQSETYGIVNDAHILKNSEWGAITYLTHSKYGYEGTFGYDYGIDFEIDIGLTTLLTGYSGSTTNINNPAKYGSNASYNTTSTGNISGIFDLIGSGSETVMANYNNKLGESGFTKMPESRYYDLYTTEDEAANYRKGDAGGEVKGWYQYYDSYGKKYYDVNTSFTSDQPWIVRGGDFYSDQYEYLFGSMAWHYNQNWKDGYFTAFRVVIPNFS